MQYTLDNLNFDYPNLQLSELPNHSIFGVHQIEHTFPRYYFTYPVIPTNIQLSQRIFSYPNEYSVSPTSIQLSRRIFSYSNEYSVIPTNIQLSQRMFSYPNEYSVIPTNIQLSQRIFSYPNEYSVIQMNIQLSQRIFSYPNEYSVTPRPGDQMCSDNRGSAVHAMSSEGCDIYHHTVILYIL